MLSGVIVEDAVEIVESKVQVNRSTLLWDLMSVEATNIS